MPKFTEQELENSKRIFKSATPKQDLSWYIKWTASVFILTAVFFRAAGEDAIVFSYPANLYDQVFSLIGTLGWLCVGLLWKDRALIMLNAVIVTVLGQAIIMKLVGS